jgi:hypothetical protein
MSRQDVKDTSISFSSTPNPIRKRRQLEERLRCEVEEALAQLMNVQNSDAKCEARSRLMRAVKALNAVTLMVHPFSG